MILLIWCRLNKKHPEIGLNELNHRRRWPHTEQWREWGLLGNFCTACHSRFVSDYEMCTRKEGRKEGSYLMFRNTDFSETVLGMGSSFSKGT